jgi:hypothetical protein
VANGSSRRSISAVAYARRASAACNATAHRGASWAFSTPTARVPQLPDISLKDSLISMRISTCVDDWLLTGRLPRTPIS